MELDFDKYKAQQFCDNLDCEAYGKTGGNNIRTHSRLHHQVYCNVCKQIWVITQGTFFYNLILPLSDVTIYQQIQEKWGIDVPRGSKPTVDQLRMKAVYSYLSYSYWYIERFRNLMQLVGNFQSIAELLDPNDPRHVLLAFAGAERFAHCLLDVASYIQSQGAGDVPRLARNYLYGGPLGLKDKEKFFELLTKLTDASESLDPPWLADTIELLGRIIFNPCPASDVLRYVNAIYIWCAHLGNPEMPDISTADNHTASVVLAHT